jgi:hypothetical protein
MGFSGGIALVRQGNKYAYIRESGEMISPFHLEKALPFTNKVAWAKTKGEWRLYYETGQLVVPATPYRFVEAAANGSWRVSKDSIHWGIIDAKGYMRVPCAYKNIIWQGKDWTIADKGFGERYLFSSRLKKPVYFPFTLEMPLSSDLLLCKTYFDEPILLNTAGKVVIPIAQAITHIAKEKVFIVQQKDKMGVLDEKGMLLIPFEYDRIVFSETKQFIVTKGGLTSYIDRNNQQFNYQSQETPILRPAMPLSADNPPNFSIYEDYDAKGLRVDGVVKQPAIYSMINPNDDCWGGFWVFENGLTGWVQPNGETGIPAEYSYISNFPIDWYCMGYVVAQKNDKYGLISRENKIIIPFEYDEIADNAPNYDLLAVRKGEFWGYYNVQTNSLQQPCVYKKAGVFNGTAIITDQSGRNFVVDAKGNCVAKCTEEE